MDEPLRKIITFAPQVGDEISDCKDEISDCKKDDKIVID